MKIVLDTNVLVSGLINPYGAPAATLRLVLNQTVTLLYDVRLLLEYREVLLRPRFNFNSLQVEKFLQALEVLGVPINAKPLKIKLPDPDDLMFIEVAKSGLADYLVTGNLKHFLNKQIKGIHIVAPHTSIDLITKGKEKLSNDQN
ncbi:MAG: putative toxin-antitoxin system toxin component, PIN family [Deltaproteobacteria bacterium]|nr:putative toxin-antitoxin system toxin component, PIN family [Deltaproteobacteria bacterium]